MKHTVMRLADDLIEMKLYMDYADALKAAEAIIIKEHKKAIES